MSDMSPPRAGTVAPTDTGVGTLQRHRRRHMAGGHRGIDLDAEMQTDTRALTRMQRQADTGVDSDGYTGVDTDADTDRHVGVDTMQRQGHTGVDLDAETQPDMQA